MFWGGLDKEHFGVFARSMDKGGSLEGTIGSIGRVPS